MLKYVLLLCELTCFSSGIVVDQPWLSSPEQSRALHSAVVGWHLIISHCVHEKHWRYYPMIMSHCVHEKYWRYYPTLLTLSHFVDIIRPCYTLASMKLNGVIQVSPCPSVHLSIRLRTESCLFCISCNTVAGSISYLHILSANLRNRVTC